MLCTTMVIAASEHVAHREHTFHRRVTRTWAVLTIACAALGVARPAPLVLGLILVAILGVPWGLAVAHRIQEGMPMRMHKVVSPAEAADRLAIRELFDAYAHCADHRDATGQLSLFTTDARLIVYMDARSDQPTQDLRGHEQIMPVFENLRSYRTTTHFNGQSTIHLDGDRATGESYCLAHHLYDVDGQRTLMVASLRYLDQFAKQANGSWMFAERRLMVDWTETRPSNP
ncbi:nuclear transport factor 2 family protein [Nocardia sp. NBC_00565]|uniref:nuclear transport factor 2 family protein n=1 Tax=Nocardia sp. NBC_00565 TaxID=2975993 RepID=UPI002E8044CD|nr:nuclear transport factor 2 family protein [Nocardia sp. NBC_00565]WUC06574.1 nuclear transport factor 2 family protein [Nocardia sp. NBC_00565]